MAHLVCLCSGARSRGEEIERRLQKQAEGDIAAWAVVERRTGSAVGMTTYLNFDLAHRRLEIGSTWLGQKVQGTGINPAMKLLLLQRAFEELGCIAVEFRTHWHNHQSRAAIARLGAKQDGVLRNHRILPDGTLRDTVVFSILDSEWPAVKVPPPSAHQALIPQLMLKARRALPQVRGRRPQTGAFRILRNYVKHVLCRHES